MLFKNPSFDFQRQLLAITVHNGNGRFLVVECLLIQLSQQMSQRLWQPARFFHYLNGTLFTNFEQQLNVQHGCYGT
ncbi:hypothetical protein D3C74_468160 [compost metagenome]